jgi:hypothetical protein
MLRSFIAVVSAFVLIMAGVMIATVIATRVMLGSFIPPPGLQPTRAFLAVNLAYSIAFAVSGGFLAARLAPRAPFLHAAVLAGLLLALAAPSLAPPEPGVPAWYPAVIALIGPASVILGGLVATSVKRRP